MLKSLNACGALLEDIHVCAKPLGHEGEHQCWCDTVWNDDVLLPPKISPMTPTQAEYEAALAAMAGLGKARRPRRRRLVTLLPPEDLCFLRVTL